MAAAALAGLRHWHRSPRLLALAQHPVGRLGVFVLACALFVPQSPHGSVGNAVSCAVLLGTMLWPARRAWLLSAASAILLGARVADVATPLQALLGLGVPGLFLGLCLAAARGFARLPGWVRRRPLLWLQALFWMHATGAWLALREADPVAGGLAFGLLVILCFRCGYLILSGRRTSARGTKLSDHFFYLVPIFGGTPVPFGKGFDYLRRCAARDAPAQAAAQLAGLKCLGLAALWRAAAHVLGVLVHGDPAGRFTGGLAAATLDLPRLAELIAADAEAGLALRWAAVFLELVGRTLEVAVVGHLVIGLLRLLGFHVFRDTYKPLLAESLVDFWNRFHHYFKELLVQLFFFPTYAAHFKSRPRLRLVAAVFAAAWLGNVYYHVIDLMFARGIPSAGLEAFAADHVSRAFYAFWLAVGISVSMLREQRRRGGAAPEPSWRTRAGRLRRIAGVWLFFATLHIWTVEPTRLSFAQHSRFAASLLGL